MPIYTYRCPKCSEDADHFRTIAERNDAPGCASCGHEHTDRVVSQSQAVTWNPNRRFPHLSQHTHDGSRTFETKAEYEAHLKEHGWTESFDGFRYTHGGKTRKVYGKREEKPQPPGLC